MGQSEILSDGPGGFPQKKAGLDGLPLLVIADSTLTLVAQEVGGGFGSSSCTEYGFELYVRTPWAV